jgi:hypothetical protein
MTEEISSQEKAADPVFAGRIDILYALGRHYLSLPFAVLCVPATIIAGHSGDPQFWARRHGLTLEKAAPAR